jgi:hypothetical protein
LSVAITVFESQEPMPAKVSLEAPVYEPFTRSVVARPGRESEKDRPRKQEAGAVNFNRQRTLVIDLLA